MMNMNPQSTAAEYQGQKGRGAYERKLVPEAPAIPCLEGSQNPGLAQLYRAEISSTPFSAGSVQLSRLRGFDTGTFCIATKNQLMMLDEVW